jgi:hypothetical protein
MRTTLLKLALITGVSGLTGCATAPPESAMSIAQSGPSELVEEVKAVPSLDATVEYCYPKNLKKGNSYIALWKTGQAYTAETWFSANFKGKKSCLTTYGGKGFRIDWDIDVYGFLHEVGLYDLSIKADAIKDSVKANHDHELNNMTGGGGYTGLYGWFGKAGAPDAIELYINDNWSGPINMSDCIKMGTVEVDGDTYDIYTRPRRGDKFAQWWSNRRTARTSGEISYAKHFQAWRRLGMPNANLTRLTFSFEVKWGQPSGGSAVYKSFHIDPPVPR